VSGIIPERWRSRQKTSREPVNGAEPRRMPSYREQVEAEIAALTRELLDSAEEHYGAVPHVDVFGVVVAVNYTPDDAELDNDQAFTHDAVSFKFSDQKPWVQVGVLRAALRLAESDD
jgi:hypothetical protein